MIKWFGNLTFILLICLSRGESENINIDEEAMEICRNGTSLSEGLAVGMIDPDIKPESRDEMCFLKCYYEKHPVSATGNYQVEAHNDEYDVSVSDETAHSKNNVVQTCIEHATFKNASDPCELGLITRLCHQQYNRLLNQLMRKLIDQLNED